MKIVETQGSW